MSCLHQGRGLRGAQILSPWPGDLVDYGKGLFLLIFTATIVQILSWLQEAFDGVHKSHLDENLRFPAESNRRFFSDLRLLVFNRSWPQSTYILRVQSSVWRLLNYWPPTPSPPSEYDARHLIGLLQYNPSTVLTMELFPTAERGEGRGVCLPIGLMTNPRKIRVLHHEKSWNNPRSIDLDVDSF